jgi:serine/threonine protein kinase
MQLEELFNKYDLGKLTEEPKQITGGLMHRMYQVTTEDKKYAVKEMNPSIMKRPGVVENITKSDRVAEALKGIVSVISAIYFNDSPLLMLDARYYMVFEWLDGISIFPPDITIENCIKIV